MTEKKMQDNEIKKKLDLMTELFLTKIKEFYEKEKQKNYDSTSYTRTLAEYNLHLFFTNEIDKLLVDKSFLQQLEKISYMELKDSR